jgi:DNA-binding transcriptional regulator YiaG
MAVENAPKHSLSDLLNSSRAANVTPEVAIADKALDRAIGVRLQSLREGQGLSLGDLATRSGVSKAMIARAEGGKQRDRG